MLPLQDIQRASRALGEAGLDAAGRGALSEARRLLLESIALSDDDARYLKALGYCAFAVGDVGAAYDAWRRAELLLGGRGSIPWVRSLEHGILRVTVDRYNSAVTLAKQGKYREADAMLDRVLEEVPDFAPAGKAKGIALMGLGDQIGAHRTLSASRHLHVDDPDFDRLLAAAALRPSGRAAEPVVSDTASEFSDAGAGKPFPVRTAAAVAAVIILAAIALWPRGRDDDRTAGKPGVATSAGSGSTSNPSTASRSDFGGSSRSDSPSAARPLQAAEVSARATKTPPTSRRSNFTARYRQGEAAAVRGDWARAIVYLSPVGEFGAHEPYHAHVLALLAEGYVSMGRNADARRIAWMLVQKYPDSQYITPELRNIAGTDEEHEK